MNNKSRRTGVTDLTDAELEVLDQVAMGSGGRASFRAGVFSEQYNRPFHGLDEEALKASFDRFENLGWTTGRDLSSHWSASDRSVEITAGGGILWESERLPDWTRLVTDVYGRRRPGSQRHRVSIIAHSPAFARAFFDAGCQSGFFAFSRGPLRAFSGYRRLIYWKLPQRVHVFSAWLELWHSPTDWSLMESNRCWWRFPDEIGTLWGLPPA
jgi:hypothetical protein